MNQKCRSEQEIQEALPLGDRPTILVPDPRPKTFDEDEQRYENPIKSAFQRVREIMEGE